MTEQWIRGCTDDYNELVAADGHHTAWEPYGKRHSFAAGLPHGDIRIVRHDLARQEARG